MFQGAVGMDDTYVDDSVGSKIESTFVLHEQTYHDYLLRYNVLQVRKLTPRSDLNRT